MKTAAFIFCLLGTIAAGWCVIPLLWCIPMTVHVYKARNYETTLSTGFKICTLLFLSLVGGILLLCDND